MAQSVEVWGQRYALWEAEVRSYRSGDEGEVVVRGPMVMQGYCFDDTANRDAFCNGWFRTGDAGLVDNSGYLFLRGRLKEIINRGGEKVLPEEGRRCDCTTFGGA